MRSEGQPSEARTRLLNTATRLFYTEGIHAVGIDRIVAEAQVTRATLYRHFPGKEELVLAYLNEVDAYRVAAGAVLEGIESGILSVSGQSYPLSEAARAHADLEAGRTSGALYLRP